MYIGHGVYLRENSPFFFGLSPPEADEGAVEALLVTDGRGEAGRA